MGYYTRYRLEIVEGDQDLLATLQEESDAVQHAVCDDGSTFEEVKWYNHHTDMLELSARHPDALIRLHGDGEDPGDMWAKYFKNGKAHACAVTITYSDFDPEKLTDA